MLLCILRHLGVKVILYKHSHDVRNATASIWGIMRQMAKSGQITVGNIRDMTDQLARIEKSLRYVRKLNKGK